MKAALAQKTCRSSRWLGGFGAVIGCSGMVIAAFSGAVGAATTGAAKSDSMAGMGQSSSNPGWVNAINSVGQPLLVVSLVLVIIGLVPRGPVPTALAAIGAIGFYSFMFVQYSLPLAILSALVLVAAYTAALLINRRAVTQRSVS